jgi:hypothetical protein
MGGLPPFVKLKRQQLDQPKLNSNASSGQAGSQTIN